MKTINERLSFYKELMAKLKSKAIEFERNLSETQVKRVEVKGKIELLQEMVVESKTPPVKNEEKIKGVIKEK